MHVQRVVLMLVAGVGVLATFLPWYELAGRGIDGTELDDSEGWITLGLFAAALLLSIAGSPGRAIGGNQRLVACFLALGAAALGGYKIYDFESSESGLGAIPGFLEVGVGLYAVVGAGAAFALVAFLLGLGRR